MKVKASDFKETTDDHMKIKQRKARQATDESNFTTWVRGTKGILILKTTHFH